MSIKQGGDRVSSGYLTSRYPIRAFESQADQPASSNSPILPYSATTELSQTNPLLIDQTRDQVRLKSHWKNECCWLTAVDVAVCWSGSAVLQSTSPSVNG